MRTVACSVRPALLICPRTDIFPRAARRVACTAAAAHRTHGDSPHPPAARWWGLSSPYDAEIAGVAVPALCGMLMDPAVSAISTAFVGHIGRVELAAVSLGSLATAFNTFIFSFLMFLTIPEVAAAVATYKPGQVSKAISKSMWVAAACGVFSCAVTFFGADAIISCFRPPEPALAQQAAAFLRVRAFGIIPALLGYVITASFRGHKDTRTPLLGTTLLAVTGVSLNILFLHVLHWGVVGSALAATLATTMACGVMCGVMLSRDMLRLSDLRVLPSWEAVQPMLAAAVPLTIRNAILIVTMLYASLLCTRTGSVHQASFEVVRQLHILSSRCFECLSVAAQVLCAAYLGAQDHANARAVMLRVAFISVAVAGTVGVAMFASRAQLAQAFSRDPGVVFQVLVTVPLLAATLPLEALASVFDGGLMAAKDTNYLSAVQITAIGFQMVAMTLLTYYVGVQALTVFASFKVFMAIRLGGSYYRNFLSPVSVYAPKAAASDVAGQTGATDAAVVKGGGHMAGTGAAAQTGATDAAVVKWSGHLAGTGAAADVKGKGHVVGTGGQRPANLASTASPEEAGGANGSMRDFASLVEGKGGVGGASSDRPGEDGRTASAAPEEGDGKASGAANASFDHGYARAGSHHSSAGSAASG